MKSSLVISTPVPALDPELTLLGRFLRFFQPAAPLVACPVLVRISRNSRGGWSLYPHNAAARALLVVNGDDGEAGNFASECDAARRAAWNAWDVTSAARAHS
jgi:hypothetical protein